MNERPCELGRGKPERRATSRMVLVVVAVAVLLIVLVPATGSSSQSAARGALAFVSDRDGVASVYVINADGKGLRRLVRNATEPRWAPDGQRLSFVRGGVLHVLTLRGLRERRLVAADSFDWSPDSRRIVYSAGGIYVVGRDGRERRRLTTESDGKVAWSPDGSRIAFVRATGNVRTLFVMNLDGSQLRQLATDVPYAGGPVWSPDGKELAVAREETDDELLVGVGVADGKQRVLIRKGFEILAAWSPDGSRIAVTGLIGGSALHDGHQARRHKNRAALRLLLGAKLVAGQSDEWPWRAVRISGLRAPTGRRLPGSFMRTTRTIRPSGIRGQRRPPASAGSLSQRRCRPTRGRSVEPSRRGAVSISLRRTEPASRSPTPLCPTVSSSGTR